MQIFCGKLISSAAFVKFHKKNVPEQPYASFLRACVSLGTIVTGNAFLIANYFKLFHAEIFLVVRYAILVKYRKIRKEIRMNGNNNSLPSMMSAFRNTMSLSDEMAAYC